MGQEVGLIRMPWGPSKFGWEDIGALHLPQPAQACLLYFALPLGPWYLHPRHRAHSSALRRHEEGLKVQQLEEVVCLEEGLLGNTEGQVAPNPSLWLPFLLKLRALSRDGGPAQGCAQRYPHPHVSAWEGRVHDGG